MAEEFEESDVVFTGNNDYEDGDHHCFVKCFGDSDSEESRGAKRKKIDKKISTKKAKAKAKAVNIPEIFSWFHVMEPSLFEHEEGEMIPPHVMVLRRRVAEKMAFSVCSGMGRTLKGRDLSEVRNCVLRMTGFLET
ncbi:uncharacterized protein LOC112526869 [Cynara cardunculus var. scolymus]|uniref:Senescence regulator n=1 Tax=Cynara cardunculus var. scolymus TaxID=59895 RepID=A0A103XEW5_CYNCS|nr:uncharacterized protein LOC112526869 [Cynara cardunculus var. scolymus]KVH89436.1 Senescence regulator [Cynara cardunculus var. scolymus]